MEEAGQLLLEYRRAARLGEDRVEAGRRASRLHLSAVWDSLLTCCARVLSGYL